jgi:hypothetical protein
MQALHGLHNLQKHHKKNEWPIVWSKAAAKCRFDLTNEEFSAHQIPAPILTRRWTVGECAAYLLKHMTIILALCHGVIQASTTAHAVNQVASGVQALLKTPQIVSDNSLINAYHKCFLCSHFAWLQKGDPELGGKPGFINRRISVGYFLMHKELSLAYNMEGWKTIDATFLSQLDGRLGPTSKNKTNIEMQPLPHDRMKSTRQALQGMDE